jgi:hypothetical protein
VRRFNAPGSSLLVALTVAAAAAGCQGARLEGGTADADAAISLDGAAGETQGSSDADASAGADASSDAPGPAIVCPPGLMGCADGARLVCADDGASFTTEACAADLFCLEGACVGCLDAADCAAEERCVEHACAPAPLRVLTDALPPALEGAAYAVTLLAEGGEPPYTWDVAAGALPPGMSLAAQGAAAGTSTEPGVHAFEARVTDAAGAVASAELSIEVLEHGLHITTASPLPAALEGEPYAAQLAAVGGALPYFWGVSEGTLPPGLALSSTGEIGGTPTGAGSGAFVIKVFDDGTPTLTAHKAFELPVKLAPLEIVGDQVVDLFVAKLVVLPLIVVVDLIPIPYNGKLEAKGGKKPYSWTEVPMPGFVSSFIPNAGLPAGLTLNADGSITGGVSDASLVVSIDIPFVGITLSGFFFAAEVADSQSPPEKATGLFIIPTVPIGN